MYTETIRDRLSVIERYARPPRRVLDVGCVDARPERAGAAERIQRKPNLLHKRLKALNPDLLGVDFDAEGVAVLNAMGFQVAHADAETVQLGRRFDTIVAGEIIEHLPNPGRFLRNMRGHLEDDGVIIISTPNPFYSAQVWKIWRYGRPSVNEGHMSWQDPITLHQLLRASGLEPVEGYWIQPPGKLLKTWKRWLRPYFSHSFLCLAKKA